MPESPFRLTVYDRWLRRRGWIGAPISVDAHPKHNDAGYTTVTVPTTHPRVPDLITPGARMVIEYDNHFLMSGRVGKIQGKGPTMQSEIEVTVEDDFRLLSRMLGWPNPAGKITAQGDETAYDSKTGPAETVVKHFVSRNASRSLPQVTVAGDAGRGRPISVSMRMHPLTDRLLPAVDQAGIGIDVRQQGNGLVVDCYEPTVRRQLLTEETGVVVDWSWTTQAPTATRAVVGAQGEGTERTFTYTVDAALEEEWNETVEVFRDARDTSDESTLDARADESILDGAPKAGISLTLTESRGWRYGRSVRVGDQVTTQIAPGADITDVVREASIQWTRDGGLQVTPVVGDRGDDPSVTLRHRLAALAQGVRDLKAR